MADELPVDLHRPQQADDVVPGIAAAREDLVQHRIANPPHPHHFGNGIEPPRLQHFANHRPEIADPVVGQPHHLQENPYRQRLGNRCNEIGSTLRRDRIDKADSQLLDLVAKRHHRLG